MKRTASRLISILLILVMLLSLTPAVFASDEEGNEQELFEETVENNPVEEAETNEAQASEKASEEGELPEEPGEETPEEPVEEPCAEETVSEEKPAEETGDAVKVIFTFTDEFRVAVPADAEFTPAVREEQEEKWSLELELLPGSYTWLAQAKGHKDSEVTALEIPEGSEAVTVELELEAYPFDIEGMALSFDMGDGVLEGKNFLTDNDVPNLVAGLTPDEDYVDEEVIFNADTEEYALEVAAAFGAELVRYKYKVAVIRLPDGLSVAQAVAASADSELRLPAVDPNYIIRIEEPAVEEPDDALSASLAKAPTQGWLEWKDKLGKKLGAGAVDPALRDPASHDYQYHHEILNTYEAWATTTGSSAVKAVVIDTGIDLDHPDFQGHIAGTDYYDASLTSAQDYNGHGSNCAGILSAKMGNGTGGAGVAPGISLYAFNATRTYTEGGKTKSELTQDGINAGYVYAKGIGADIISASLGGFAPVQSEYELIKSDIEAGITFVAAAGNDASNIKSYPGAYDIPGLICVGATDRANKQCVFSDYGSWVDIYAPGFNIYSCNNAGGYSFMSGTSQATPAVAGVCALYMSMYGHRGVTPVEMEKVIKSCKTNGVLDAYKVINKGYAKAVRLGFTEASLAAGLEARFADSASIPRNVNITLSNDSLGSGEYIAYTLDGTAPGCIDGVLANGEVYDGNGISLVGFKPGDEVTLTARCIASNGEGAECIVRRFTVAEEKDFTAVTLTGPEKLTAEEKAAFKATDCFGDDITARVTWKVTSEDGSPCSDVTIDRDGFISYPAEKSGRAVVTALSENGGTASLTVEFPGEEITASLMVSEVVLTANNADGPEAVSASYDRKGVLKTVTLYNADLVSTSQIKENVISLGTNVASAYAEWKSSNTKVAVVDGNGKVTAVGKGSATITCIANDGSKKKASVKITVKIPVSSVTISSKSTVWDYSTIRDSDGFDTNCYLLAIGKSASNKAILGDAYGKPTDKKVLWSATMEIYDHDSGSHLFDFDPGYYFTISSSGSLSVKNTLKQLSYMQSKNYEVWIKVYAYSNNDQYFWKCGTAYDDEAFKSVAFDIASYRITWPTSEVFCYYVDENDGLPRYYRSEWIPVGCSYFTNGIPVGYVAIDRKYPCAYFLDGAFTVTSSNPKVAGAKVTGPYTFNIWSGQKTGTATITIKMIDGSNKSYKFKIKVYDPG